MYNLESNILKDSNLTAEQLIKAVDVLVPDNHLKVMIPAAVHAEKKHGVSALWIVAHAATETGWGKSIIARTRNNFFGFNAIDSNPANATKYKTAGDSVEYYASFVKEHYLTKGGKYYNGPTPHGVMIRYASAGDRAARTIVEIMNLIAEKIGPQQPDGFPRKTTEKKPAKVEKPAEKKPKQTEEIEKPDPEPIQDVKETKKESENEPTETEPEQPSGEQPAGDDSKKNCSDDC